VAETMALRMCLRRVYDWFVVDHRGHLRAEGYCDMTCG